MDNHTKLTCRVENYTKLACNIENQTKLAFSMENLRKKSLSHDKNAVQDRKICLKHVKSSMQLTNFPWKQKMTLRKYVTRSSIWGKISDSSFLKTNSWGCGKNRTKKYFLDIEKQRCRLKNITEANNKRSKSLPKFPSIEFILKIATPPSSFRSKAPPQISCLFC